MSISLKFTLKFNGLKLKLHNFIDLFQILFLQLQWLSRRLCLVFLIFKSSSFTVFSPFPSFSGVWFLFFFGTRLRVVSRSSSFSSSFGFSLEISGILTSTVRWRCFNLSSSLILFPCLSTIVIFNLLRNAEYFSAFHFSYFSFATICLLERTRLCFKFIMIEVISSDS